MLQQTLDTSADNELLRTNLETSWLKRSHLLLWPTNAMQCRFCNRLSTRPLAVDSYELTSRPSWLKYIDSPSSLADARLQPCHCLPLTHSPAADSYDLTFETFLAEVDSPSPLADARLRPCHCLPFLTILCRSQKQVLHSERFLPSERVLCCHFFFEVVALQCWQLMLGLALSFRRADASLR